MVQELHRDLESQENSRRIIIKKKLHERPSWRREGPNVGILESRTWVIARKTNQKA